MNRQDYRAAFDAIPFDEDFQEKTINALRQRAGQAPERKVIFMKKNRFALIAAALSALLVVSAAAAVLMLSPKDVAQHAGNQALAAAFESGEAITVNETKTVGDYRVTLMGLVSGEGLSQVESLPGGVSRDKTYAVLAYARTDGIPIEEDVPDLTVSPLVEGYAPWQLNAWVLGGGTHTFAQDGTLYYLFECDNVEPFADHTVYLSVYPGTHVPPSAELFDYNDATGSITAKGDTAMFVLPLDQNKADPGKAQEIAGDFLAPVPSEAPDVDPNGVVFSNDVVLSTETEEQ